MHSRGAAPFLALSIIAIVGVGGCAGAAAEQAAFKKIKDKGGKIVLKGKGPEISFSHLKIVDDDFACLAELSRIHEIKIENVELTDAGLEHLLKVDRIDEISLIRTAVTKDGVNKLKAKFPDCGITHR